jgi:uncharacterized protein
MFAELGQNRIFWTVVLAWATAQILKVLTGIIRERRLDAGWFFVTGGMPSTHVSGVTCLSVCIGRQLGFDSVAFSISAVFMLIVMFDAQGVRQVAGLLAKTANRMIEDLYGHTPADGEVAVHIERVKELSGHTIREVFGGVLVGSAIAVFAGGS